MRNHALFVAFMGVFVLLLIVGGLYVATLLEEQALPPAKNETPSKVFVSLACPNCTQDILHVQDCAMLLKDNQTNAQLQQAAKDLHINLDNPIRVAKKVRLGTAPEVTCYYYG